MAVFSVNIGKTYKAKLIVESSDGEEVALEIYPLESFGMSSEAGEQQSFPGSLASVSTEGRTTITLVGAFKRTPQLRPDVS